MGSVTRPFYATYCQGGRVECLLTSPNHIKKTDEEEKEANEKLSVKANLHQCVLIYHRKPQADDLFAPDSQPCLCVRLGHG